MALVDFYQWPVVMKPWGPKEDCYKWPYYFTHTPERTRATEALARSYAALADDMITRHGKSVALIGMEALDEALLRKVHGYMAHPDRARIFCSREYNASQMVSILRSLELLLTSRYHACVLSLAAQVPQIAVGHDLRLKTIYQELGLFEDFFVEPNAHDLYESLQPRVERLLEDPSCVRDALRRGYEKHLSDAQRNRSLLKNFVQAHGLGACTQRDNPSSGGSMNGNTAAALRPAHRRDRFPGRSDRPAAAQRNGPDRHRPGARRKPGGGSSAAWPAPGGIGRNWSQPSPKGCGLRSSQVMSRCPTWGWMKRPIPAWRGASPTSSILRPICA